jgi:hypothetical protein
MLLEIAGALLVGLLVLWLVFEPLLLPGRGAADFPEPPALEETRQGAALLALKEIEFDRETGKLSDDDYTTLKARYGAEALAAMTQAETSGNGSGQEGAGDPEAMVTARLHQLRSARLAGEPATPSCVRCGPRPESDALFCSTCGGGVSAAGFCSSCGTPLGPDNRFCAECGTRIAA